MLGNTVERLVMFGHGLEELGYGIGHADQVVHVHHRPPIC
jgi:hypothetical protein